MYDRRTGQSFTQICVGNISDATKPCPWSTSTGAVGDRIEYTHHPTVNASLDIDLRNTKTFRADSGPGGGTGRGGGGAAGGAHDTLSGGLPTSTVGAILRPDKRPEPFRTELENSRPGQTTPRSVTDQGDLWSHSAEQHQQQLPLFNSSPSYGLVTVLSEPLESRIEARLVHPRGTPKDNAMRASRESRTDPNVRRGSVEAGALGEGESPTVDNPAASISAALGHSPANDSSTSSKNSIESAENQRHLGLNCSAIPVDAAARGDTNREQDETSLADRGSDSSPLAVNAILGPVIGRAEVVRQSGGIRESCRVAVVLEVDGDSIVTCVVSLSAEVGVGLVLLGFGCLQ